jgi:hypothetical protein
MITDTIYVIMKTTGEYGDKWTHPVEFALYQTEAENRVNYLQKQADEIEHKINTVEFSDARQSALDEFDTKWKCTEGTWPDNPSDQFYDEWHKIHDDYPEYYEPISYSWYEVKRRET